MDPCELLPIVEGLIFAAEAPLSADQIAEIVEVERNLVHGLLNDLRRKYEAAKGGIELSEVAGGFQFRTRPDLSFWIRRLQKRKTFRLSRAALEILAIVAYRQPVTRTEMEQVRGVDCDGPLRTLLEKGLLRICGRRDSPGRPLLYGTAPSFLEAFGMRDLAELPDLRQIEQLFAEEPTLPFSK
ncbi:MAG: SMC-Scp complex subunit ScpB [Deltaproteobacteria bacterium]|nr:SMC-Scp complex subunit ScpB [Deltaproteobacteria bacterium]